MGVTKLPSATYWFVLGFVRAKLNDEDFKYVEQILAESLIGNSQISNDKPNQQEGEVYNSYSRL